MALRKTKLTPTIKNIGQKVICKFDGEYSILVNISHRGTAACNVVGPRGGVKYHFTTDVRNLEVVDA